MDLIFSSYINSNSKPSKNPRNAGRESSIDFKYDSIPSESKAILYMSLDFAESTIILAEMECRVFGGWVSTSANIEQLTSLINETSKKGNRFLIITMFAYNSNEIAVAESYRQSFLRLFKHSIQILIIKYGIAPVAHQNVLNSIQRLAIKLLMIRIYIDALLDNAMFRWSTLSALARMYYPFWAKYELESKGYGIVVRKSYEYLELLASVPIFISINRIFAFSTFPNYVGFLIQRVGLVAEYQNYLREISTNLRSILHDANGRQLNPEFIIRDPDYRNVANPLSIKKAVAEVNQLIEGSIEEISQKVKEMIDSKMSVRVSITGLIIALVSLIVVILLG